MALGLTLGMMAPALWITAKAVLQARAMLRR
jgi:hypothetical protein